MTNKADVSVNLDHFAFFFFFVVIPYLDPLCSAYSLIYLEALQICATSLASVIFGQSSYSTIRTLKPAACNGPTG